MSSKILVIISTSDIGKASAGLMYALNATRNLWMEDVRLVFFGPAQDSITNNLELQELLQNFHTEGGVSLACKFIADRDETTSAIDALGVKVEYVGSNISDIIKDGYIPMVW